MMKGGRPWDEKPKKTAGFLFLLLALFLPPLSGCDTALGGTESPGTEPGAESPGDGPGPEPGAEQPGGEPGTLRSAADIAKAIDPWSGVWYSRYDGRKLDGYRIGKWKDRHSLLPLDKLEQLFPGFAIDAPRFFNYIGAPYDAAIDFPAGGEYPAGLDDAYFIFYDDTAYEAEPGDGGNGGWGARQTRYMGIVRAVNTFSDGAGAVIIQYLQGCFPNWDEDFTGPPPRCYFGIYYRAKDQDTIQMANAVDLKNLSSGKKYYTETATLEDAIAKNTAENESKFVSWGVAIEQKREEEERVKSGEWCG
jgi:hypothetical protein